MNSDTYETAEQLANESGAIKLCSICGTEIYSCDEEADRRTYGKATNEWKARVREFRSMGREEVMKLVESVLNDAPTKCRCF